MSHLNAMLSHETLRAARNFQSAMQTVRQLESALFDMLIHVEYNAEAGARVHEMLDRVRRWLEVVEQPAFNRFAHGFSHVFSDAYAAGYDSYKRAEALSSDAYSQFEENVIFNRTTGLRFRQQVLERVATELRWNCLSPAEAESPRPKLCCATAA